MASDDFSGSRPAAPIVLRIKLRYDDVEVMVQRFAANVGKSGLFLPTRSLQPLGAEIKFELRLADDTPVLVGLGRVKAAVPPDPQRPRAAFGMAIELMRVTPQSRALILRMLERRRELGLPELGLPMAPDIDTARRAEGGESGGRDTASGSVPVVTPLAVASSPSIAPPPVAPPPVAPPLVAPSEATPGEAPLTAPRRTTGPVPVAKLLAVAPLLPEPPRKRRVAISEIIESASGPAASVSTAMPGLDDDVDIAATLARARALAGCAIDAELEALSHAAAAPLEISIDAASAELARQLGGSAVRRDRAAGWAPPPVTAPATPASAPGAEPESPESSESPESLEQRAPEPRELLAPEPPEPLALAPREPPTPEPAAQPEPALAADAIPAVIAGHVPAHTDAGWRPAAYGADAGAQGSRSADPDPSAAHAELAELGGAVAPASGDPGAEDGDDPHDHRERRARSFAPGDVEQIRTEPSGPLSFGSPREDSGVGAALDAEEHTEMGEVPVESSGFEPPADGDGAGELVPEARGPEAIAPPLELPADEFDGFEILAEADADDEDLLASDGEHDASKRRELHLRPRTGGHRPSQLDFAARLELGNESDLDIAIQADEFSAHHAIDSLNDERTSEHARRGGLADRPGELDPRLASSAGAALAAFETGDEPFDDPDAAGRFEPRAAVQPIFDPEPSGSFTIASIPADSIDLDTPAVVHRDAAAPSRAASRPARAIRSEPAILRKPPPVPEAPGEDDALAHALEALDADLDDLSVPRAATPPPRARSRPITAARPAEAPRSPAQPLRAPLPTPAQKLRASVPPPAPRPRAPVPTSAPQPRAPAAMPSRAVHRAGGAPGSGRVTPRAPSESIEIDLDDDD